MKGAPRYSCIHHHGQTWTVWDTKLQAPAKLGETLVGRSRPQAEAACRILNRIDESERDRMSLAAKSKKPA